MVLRIKLRTAKDSYIQLIEGYAHRKLPVKQRSFGHYLCESLAARLLGVNADELLEFLLHSKDVHAVFLENGQVFVHPDGLVQFISKDNCRFTHRFVTETINIENRIRIDA